MGDDRPSAELELAAALVVDTDAVTSLGSKSGVNWMRLKVQPGCARQRLGEHGLAHARHVFDQQMAAGRQADDGQLDFGGLTDQDLFNRGLEGAKFGAVHAPWQRLNFLPEPHGQGSLRPTLVATCTAWLRAGRLGTARAVAPRWPVVALVGPLSNAPRVGGGRRLLRHLQVIDGVDDLGADRRLQVVEHPRRLDLVFDQRVTLAVCPQADALAQVVDARQVLDPQPIHHVEHPHALEAAHEIVAELLLFVVVGCLGQLHQVVDHLFSIVQALDVIPREVLGHREDALDLLLQRLDVPVVAAAAQLVTVSETSVSSTHSMMSGLRLSSNRMRLRSP